MFIVQHITRRLMHTSYILLISTHCKAYQLITRLFSRDCTWNWMTPIMAICLLKLVELSLINVRFLTQYMLEEHLTSRTIQCTKQFLGLYSVNNRTIYKESHFLLWEKSLPYMNVLSNHDHCPDLLKGWFLTNRYCAIKSQERSSRKQTRIGF